MKKFIDCSHLTTLTLLKTHQSPES